MRFSDGSYLLSFFEDELGEYTSYSFRIYHRSQLLPSIQTIIDRQQEFNKKIVHYHLSCIEEEFDIISWDEPRITKISP